MAWAREECRAVFDQLPERVAELERIVDTLEVAMRELRGRVLELEMHPQLPGSPHSFTDEFGTGMET